MKGENTASSPFVIMVKPVGSLCNLECGYCYYLETAKYFDGSVPRMSDELLEDFISRYIRACPGEVIQFVWHGGEPALAGLDFYRRAVELQKKYLPEGRECWNNLQTNGVLLDDEWCDFLAANRFDVGLSLDGTQWLHDEFRRDHAGNGTHALAEEAVRRLMSRGLRPDLLCTVNSRTIENPREVYNALKRLGTGWVQFIPIVRREPDGRLTSDSVTGVGYGEFLCEVFDEWAINDIGRTDVQLFAEAARVWDGGAASLCWMAPTCGRALIVERDGGVYSCDHFVAPEHCLGNLRDADLAEMADSERQQCFGNNKRDALPRQCRECEWLPVCNGGCPKDRFFEDRYGEGGLNCLCDGYRRFFTHAHKTLARITAERRSGASPSAIMARLRGEAQEKWKGVGRNNPCPCGSGRKAKNCCWSKRP